MKRPQQLSIFALVLALFGIVFHSGSALADRVEKKSGRVIHGVILDENEQYVSIQTGAAEIKIPRSSIRRIVRGSPADHFLLEAKDQISRGDARAAIGALGRAAGDGVDPTSLAAVMLRHRDEIAEAIPRLGAGGRDALAVALEGVADVNYPRPGDLLLARILWHLEFGDLEGVRNLLKEMRERHGKAYENARAQLVAWLSAKADDALGAGRHSEAIDLLVELRRLDPQAAGDRRAMLVLTLGREARDRGDYRRAIEQYESQLMDISPNIAIERIETTLLEAEVDYRAQGRLGRAIDLWEEFGATHLPEQAPGRLLNLWRELGRMFQADGKVGSARKCFGNAELIESGSADMELKQCDYLDRRAAIASTDYVGHYDLGEWALDAGLNEEARQAFDLASGSDVLRENAWTQMRRIDDALAEEELSRLMGLYDAGKFFELVERLGDFRERPLGPGLREQATRLGELARDAITLSASERPQQAEVLWQLAERAYYSGELDEAEQLIQTIIQRYAGTPAAERAAAFYRKVRPRMDLNRIERGRRATAIKSYGGADSPTTTPAAESSTEIAREIERLKASSRNIHE